MLTTIPHRRSIWFYFTILTLLFSDLSLAGRYWIFFTDKETITDESLSQLRSEWTERSLNRRLKSGVGLDIKDAPVEISYLNGIADCGARVIHISRWLNAASVEADSAIINNLLELGFVNNIQPVAQSNRDDICLVESTTSIDTSINDDHSLIPRGAYGESWWQAEQSGAIDAHKKGLTGAGVLIGMLDTGFELNHRAFAGLYLLYQYDFIIDDTDPSYDYTTDRVTQPNHGTACLSVIAGYDPGYIVGIAPRSTVALAKTELTGTEIPQEEDYWVAGIEWMEWLGADVVSSSLSYSQWYWKNNYDGRTSPASRAAQRASELGVVICNSAGNAGPEDITLGAPADAVDVLAIAAVDAIGEITGFSSRGPSSDGRIKPDVAALGRKVTCVQPGTWDRYGQWNGTSLACPIVAGVVALVIEAHPDWSSRRVIDAIRQTANQSFKPDHTYGYGLVNAASAVEYPSLYGRIIHSMTAQILPDISLTLSGKADSYSTFSDAQGFYKFVNLNSGSYRLTATIKGVESPLFEEMIVVPPSLPMDIAVGDSL